MTNLKDIILKITIVLLGISFIGVSLLYNQNRIIKNELNLSTEQVKAYIAENSSLQNDNREFRMTIEQLDYYNDSLLQKLNSVRKDLNIKDKELKNLQYLLSISSKKDTIVYKDTIFRDNKINKDTLIGDSWYNVKLSLQYPSTIITEPTFISEKYIITNYKKETVNPPKKCFILRGFQKKHKVVEVVVVEKNPYIKNKQQRFIEIVK